MAKDVLITPLDGIIQFSASDGAGTGQIKVDNNDLVISNLVGDVLLGDGASDVFIGNGSDNVDIVFEQSGEIRDDGSGKTITIGSKTTTLILSSSTDLTLQGGGGNVGIGTTTAGEQLEVIGNISASGFVSASAFGGDGSALTNISSTPPTGTISSSAQFGSSDNVQFNQITASVVSASSRIHASDIRDFSNGHLTIRPDADLNLGTTATDEINIGRTSSTSCDINMFANSTDPTLRIVNKTATFNHPVTASADIRLAGNISMSAGGRIGVRPEEIGGGSDLGTTTTHNADSIQFHITDGEAVVIDNARRVGIGNSNPSQQLNVTGNISASGHVYLEDNKGIQFGQTSENFISGSSNDIVIAAYDDIFFKGLNMGTEILHIKGGESIVELTGTLDVSSHITSSGNISATGEIKADHFLASDQDDGYHFGDSSVALQRANNSLEVKYSTVVAQFSNTIGLNLTGNITASGNISASGTIQSTGNISSDGTGSFVGGIDLEDNHHLNIGTGNDLKIYHNGSDSFIQEAGTGKLILDTNGTDVRITKTDSEFMAKFVTDGAVELYHNHVKKFETTTTGIDVIGNISASSHITASGNISSSGTITANSFVGNLSSDTLAAAIVAEIDNDEIPIAKLASDAITIGGAGSTALGGTATVANILKGSTVFSSSAQFQGENFNIGNMTASANISMSAGNIFVSDGAKIGYSKTQEFGDGDDTESAIKFNSANTQIIAGEKTMIHAEDGKVGIFTDTPNEVLEVKGNISASGKLIVNGGLQLGHDEVNFISASINDTIIGSADDIIFKGDGSTEIVRIRGDESQVNITGSLDVTTNITASGDISVGGNITHVGDVDTKITFSTDTIGFTAGNRLFLQFAQGTAGGDLIALGGVGGTPPIIQGDITASGNISASGGLTASGIQSTEKIKVHGRSTFGQDSPTANTSHQFHGISGDDRFLMIADKDGEEVMTGAGEVAGSDLTFKFGDVGGAGNGTIYEVDEGNSKHILKNDSNNAKVGINTNAPTKALQVTGDISASGLISAKQYQTYVCSFNDDMGTIEHGLPWGSTFENAFQADETVAFVVPCKTNVKHILMRGQGFDQNLVAGLGGATPDIKFRVKTHSPHGTAITTEGNWTTKEVATVLAPSAVDTGGKTLTYARFSGSHAQGGDAVFIGMQFSADFSNGADEFYITVVMEHDYNSLPVTGSSQRNLITGSIADGGGFGS